MNARNEREAHTMLASRAERFCCDGQCGQGRSCPAVMERQQTPNEWNRDKIALRLMALGLVAFWVCMAIAGWLAWFA
jgi:hypothetical protein